VGVRERHDNRASAAAAQGPNRVGVQKFRIVPAWASNVLRNKEGAIDIIVAALHTPDPSPQGGGELPCRERGELR